MPTEKKTSDRTNPMPNLGVLEQDFSGVQWALKEAVEQQKMGLEGLQAARFVLLKVFGRIVRLQEQIDAAFAGQAFDSNFGPLSPANMQRSTAFFSAHDQAMRLLKQAIELWCLTSGVRWECNSKTCAANNCTRRDKRPRRRPSVAVN
jgi:hypothetical protein